MNLTCAFGRDVIRLVADTRVCALRWAVRGKTLLLPDPRTTQLRSGFPQTRPLCCPSLPGLVPGVVVPL